MAEGSNPLARDPRPPLSTRVTESQWRTIDAVAAFLLAVVFVSLAARWGHQSSRHLPNWVEALLALAATLPIAVRRRRPLAVLAVVAAAVTVAASFGFAWGPNPMIALSVYTVATQYDRRRSLSALVITEVALLVALAVAELAFGKGDTVSPVVAAAAWFVGDSVRVRRDYNAGLAEQAARRQQEEIERAQRSVMDERVRIARELHDVVAHSLSVITIQAGMGRHVLDSQPEESRRALEAVETTSRGALEELRRVVGLLRQADQRSPSLSPAPGLADLTQLAHQVRAAGVPVRLDFNGEPSSLPPAIELSVYRVVQEALTNVVKHAGPARAHVTINFETDAVKVEIVDDGRGPGPRFAVGNEGQHDRATPLPTSIQDGRGSEALHHGIIGMRERVAVFGGSLEVGAGPHGGFRVAARLPLKPPAANPEGLPLSHGVP
jgi:signal transduction histidine kinase